MQDLIYFMLMIMMWNVGNFVCDTYLQDPRIQELIHSEDKTFDLIIIEGFFNDCFLGFVHKFKVPAVQVCCFGGTAWMGDFVGNPNPYAYVPNGFSDRMSFLERVTNTISEVFQRIGRKFYYLPKQDAIARKYFNYTSHLPSISELEASTAIILLNNHFSLSYPKPLMPNMVQVGGMHIRQPMQLPEVKNINFFAVLSLQQNEEFRLFFQRDIKKFLDEAPDGVIYFSMESILESSELPEVKRQAFLDAFSKRKQRVLWKWESDTLPGQPKNVIIGKWLPQSDILAHPNVRLFITHGGLLSMQETVSRGVPIVGIPVYGDQALNVIRRVSAGFGTLLDLRNITTGSVTWAIKKVLENPRYSENAQRLSRIYRDQPLTPLETAVFWTEYVIRHKGAPHMRSAVLDLTWYQYFLIDVIAVLALAVGSVLLVAFIVFRAFARRLFGGKNLAGKVKNLQKKKRH